MSTERASSGRFWPYAVVGLLAMNACIVGITVYVASTDRSFAVVPGYYEKASRWDEEVAARKLEALLGWSMQCDVGSADLRSGNRLVSVVMLDRDRQPLSGVALRGEAFHNASARERVSLEFSPGGRPGELTTILPAARPGVWTFEFSATRGLDTWSYRTEVNVGGPSR